MKKIFKMTLFISVLFFMIFSYTFESHASVETINEEQVYETKEIENNLDVSWNLELKTFYLDLNGNEYSIKKININSGTLIIKDSSPNKTGAITGISGNTSSLINVGNNATLILESGSLKNNTSREGGAIYVVPGSTFIMNGGYITNNTATNGGGIYLKDKDVDDPKGATFIMNGGYIANNSTQLDQTVSDSSSRYMGGGIYAGIGSIVNIANGELTNNTSSLGGAIHLKNNAHLEITKAIFKYNTSYRGGAIYSYQANSEIANAEISNNVAHTGAGIYLTSESSFSFQTGLISKNEASANGGGIYISYSSTFILNGGNIQGNIANIGAGVYISDANFHANNGSINANKAATNGSGVYVNNRNKAYKFYIANDLQIRGNEKDNVYLNNASMIYIDDDTTFNGTIYVTSSKTPSVEKVDNVTDYNDIEIIKLGTYNSKLGSNHNIQSDDINYIIHNDASQSKAIYIRTSHLHENQTDRFVTFLSQDTIINYLSNDESTYKLPAGTYYLTENIIVDKTIIIESKVKICLNGYLLYNNSTSNSLFYINNKTINSASLTIYDCNNSIPHYYTINSNNLSLILDDSKNDNIIYGGILSQISSDLPLIKIENGTLVMEGGKILGVNTSDNIISTTNISETTKSIITINAGAISYNNSEKAIINVASCCTFTMNGGVISNNTSTGTCINLEGEATLNGGEINNNVSNAAIYVTENSTINIGSLIKIFDNVDTNQKLINIKLDNTRVNFIAKFEGKIGIYSVPGQVTNNYSLYNSTKNPNVTSDREEFGFELIEDDYCLLNKNMIFDLTMDSWVYLDEPNQPTASATYGYENIVFTYATSQTGFQEFTSEIPTTAGKYIVKAYIPVTSEYTSAENMIPFEIIKRQVNRPTISAKTYNGTELYADINDTNEYKVISNTSGVNAGNYHIELQLKDRINYMWDTKNSENVVIPFVILPKTIEIEWGQTTFEYNGQRQCPVATIKESSLYYQDACNLVITGDKVNVGTYTATVTAISNPNYKLPAIVSTEFTITKGKNEITLELDDWIYGQTPSEPVTSSKFGDVVIFYGTSDKYIDSLTQPINAGTYYVKAKVQVHSNYEVCEVIKVFTIHQIELSYNVENQEINYGDEIKPVTFTKTSGDIIDENVVITATTPISTDAGIYPITLTTNNPNYRLIYNEDAKYTILKGITKITFNTSSWEYGYNEKLEIRYNFGTPTYRYAVSNTTQWYDGLPVNTGTYTVVANIAGNQNYSGTSAEATIIVTPRKLVLQINNKEIFYGDKDATLDYSLVSGSIKTGDDLSIQIFREQGNDAGVYQITLTTKNSNYDVTCTNGTYTIKQASTNITDFIIQSWTYESTPSIPSAKANYGKDDIVYSYSTDNINFTTTFPTNAGKYYARAEIAETKNYTADSIQTTFEIYKKEISVFISNQTSVYNNVLKKLSFTVSAETKDKLDITVTKEEGNDAGTYKITGSYNNNPNYNVKFNEGTYTITKAENKIHTLTLNDWIYNETPNTPSTTVLYGEAKYLYSNTHNGEFTDEVPTEVGDYYVLAYIPESKNYKYVEMKMHFRINKATHDTSSFVLNDLTVKYDGTPKSISLEGNIPDTVTLKYTNNDQTEPGEYNVILKFVVTDNYNAIESMMAKLTILKDSLYESDDVKINSDNGSTPNATVTVEEIVDFNLKDYQKYLLNNNRIAKLYDISFVINEQTVKPDGTITIKMSLPELLQNQDFEIIHIHNNEATSLEYELVDNQIIFKTNTMSKFVIAYKETSLVWAIVLISMAILASLAISVFFGVLSFMNINLIDVMKKKSNNSSNNNSNNNENDDEEEETMVEEIENEENSLEPETEIDEPVETPEENNEEESNSMEDASTTEIKLNSFVPLLPLLVIFNDGQFTALIILSIILATFLLTNLVLIIYNKLFKKKVDLYLENKKRQLEIQKRPYAFTVYNQNTNDDPNNMEFILHPDFTTRKFNGSVDVEINDDEKVIEDINTYQNGKLVKISYNRSFTARLCQSNDDLQAVYSILKNKLFSYNNVESSISWSYDNILLDGTPIAKFTLRGKYLTLYLALDPTKFDSEQYTFKDVSNNKKFETVPMKFKFINDKNLEDALELIDIMCVDLKLTLKETIIEADYSLPYKTTDALIETGLIKILSVTDEFGNPVTTSSPATTTTVVKEEVVTTQVVTVGTTKVIYNRSFLSKLIQSDKYIKNAFASIKNKFNSYANITSQLSWDHDTIYLGEELLGIFTIKGKTLYLYLNLEPSDFSETDYVFKDVSNDPKYTTTPMMIKIKNSKRVEQSMKLIEVLAGNNQLEASNSDPVEYNFPYQTDEELIKDELIQVIELDPDHDDDYDDEADFETEALYHDAEEQNIESNEYDEVTTLIDGKAYIITYNRSFTAKFIQSSKELQDTYQTIKNKILSYTAIKSRISWSYDSFALQNKNIARLAIKGKSLYLYLGLNPNEIDLNDYTYKDASSVKKYASTPVMLKLKNKKNIEQAKKLIDLLCKNYNLKASTLPKVDYHQHYLSQEELINAGLIKKITIETDSPEKEVSLATFIRSKITVSEAKNEMTDEEAKQNLFDTFVEVTNNFPTKKVVINIDTLGLHFENGDIVDLTSLQSKKLISNNVTHIKILARGELSKKLIVIADSFSLDAVKMITLMGGKALKKNQVVKK